MKQTLCWLRSRGLHASLGAWFCYAAAAHAQSVVSSPSGSVGAPVVEPVQSSAVAAPTDADAGEPGVELQREYRQIIARAIAEFDASHFAEARALFSRAHELWPSARTLRTLGMTAFELGMYPQAFIELQAALADARRPLPPDQREKVAGLQERARALLGRFSIRVTPPSVELSVDGTVLAVSRDSAILFPLGDHALCARAPGHREECRTLRVRDGEDGVLALELEALPAAQATIEVAPQPAELAAASSAVPVREPGPLSREATASDRGARARSTFAFVALGVGAAGVVATAVLGGLALERKGAADEHCPDKLCSDEGWRARNQMNGFATAATAASIVAGVGLAVGAVLWFTADSAQREGTRALRIEPRIGLGSAGLAGRF